MGKTGRRPEGKVLAVAVPVLCLGVAVPFGAAAQLAPRYAPAQRLLGVAMGGPPADLQYHGMADEVIPWRVEAALHRQWCAMGVTTLFTSYPGDHVTTSAEARAQVVSWLRARFAGNPAPSNC